MESVLRSDVTKKGTSVKRKGVLFIRSSVGEKDLFLNRVNNEAICVQRVRTETLKNTAKYFFSIITEKDGERHVSTDYLQSGVKENMFIGSLEVFLGAHTPMGGLLDLGYKIPSELILEIVKDRLYNENRSKEDKQSAQYTLYHSLLSIIKLLAPIMPHISEELYQKYFADKEKTKSVHISEWPEAEKIKGTAEAGDITIKILTDVRQFKSQNQKSLKAPIILTLDSKDKKTVEPFIEDLKAVTAANEIKFGKFAVEFALSS